MLVSDVWHRECLWKNVFRNTWMKVMLKQNSPNSCAALLKPALQSASQTHNKQTITLKKVQEYIIKTICISIKIDGKNQQLALCRTPILPVCCILVVWSFSSIAALHHAVIRQNCWFFHVLIGFLAQLLPYFCCRCACISTSYQFKNRPYEIEVQPQKLKVKIRHCSVAL